MDIRRGYIQYFKNHSSRTEYNLQTESFQCPGAPRDRKLSSDLPEAKISYGPGSYRD
ncbi:hypothetical protein J6590_028306 [Homalodisca vitripennis]|nr:hypothetical protein J6590_028306 [Homalodisca vitripennis]